ncbi:MAG: DEAD/DEAH box helicase [Elusimicrobia bacterium]|nr:DEAD/DEAH box helicase [Elusimicrobiota bacterium]MDE2426815.1 DEAD/DEAH box helicase [Elusimicrobiota bacterium]
MSFEQFRFDPKIAEGVRAQGFLAPTPIQARAIPKVLEGRDVLGLAQTGTGKTAAFALPILQRLLGGPRGRLRALVLAPTRELAEQTHAAFCQLGRATGLRSATVYGGVSMRPQQQALKGHAEIIVACPGRLLDHLNQGSADLSQVEVVVLDEADQMLDMGFLPDMRRIMARLPLRRQTLLFSATMPAQIRALAHEWLREPATVQIGELVPVTTVSHYLYPVKEHLKTDLLLELVKRTAGGSVLVFTRTKHRAKRLDQRLQKAGHAAASLQGNLSQNRRKQALDGFREGKFDFLVATDIAARGIDVSQISHVINFDIPNTPEAYTHRIGRTGRAARTGDAFTLVTEQDAQMVKLIERRLGRPIERRRLEGFDYHREQPLATAQDQQHGHGRPPHASGSPHGGRNRWRGRRRR